jgi:hypothetical protein
VPVALGTRRLRDPSIASILCEGIKNVANANGQIDPGRLDGELAESSRINCLTHNETVDSDLGRREPFKSGAQFLPVFSGSA